jgi:hypothetical protein
LPLGPVAVPDTLWSAPPEAVPVPAAGNYVYLQGESGDYIVGNNVLTYTQADAILTLTAGEGELAIDVDGDEQWQGHFAAMFGVDTLQVGYYGRLQRWPFHNPARGGLDWSGDGRGCNEEGGWFAIDSVTYDGTTLTAIDLRFEQHCEYMAPALHGQIHWRADDPTMPPGPATPPNGLWDAPDGSTPSDRNYVYLVREESTAGSSESWLYTQADSVMDVMSSAGYLAIDVEGETGWSGYFQTMRGVDSLVPGYYGDLGEYPFHNPVKGGVRVGLGCYEPAAWVVIDSTTYEAGTLTAIDLRFEEVCVGGTLSLHGKVHWRADDPTAPPGPATPPPDLWQPPIGATPASGSYVYLSSESGDYIGRGQTFTYTDGISSDSSDARLTIDVADWSGHFRGMSTLSQLVTGYYECPLNYLFQNLTRGAFEWSGQSRGCNQTGGWFVIDTIQYSDQTIDALDLRFEQHCEGETAALHGAIHIEP